MLVVLTQEPPGGAMHRQVPRWETEKAKTKSLRHKALRKQL